uniref:Dolichyl-diphosphooligosaccharide--protein glycosyltransferase 48 kDa subunit n=1 Tax=Romanomermis culicivorax TaxID=13658 RepID=A0A915KRS0_ROMCU
MLSLLMSIFIALPMTVLGARTLVLVDNMSTRYSHSQFFKSLSNRSHELTFKSADDASLALFKYGEPLYDNLILFCPTVENFGGSISVREIVDFIDNGGNVLIGADSSLSGIIQELANEVNFEFDEEQTYVIDHMHYDVSSDEGHHTTIVAEPNQLIPAKYIVGEPSDRPILFRGVGLVLQKASPLAVEILTASSTAYSHKPGQPVQQYPNAVGKSTILIGALQARNNGRVLLTGSLDLFSGYSNVCVA